MQSEDVITFYQSDLPCSSFGVFNDMRKSEELCDFKITVQNHSIVAHKLVVAAAIPYFRSEFTIAQRQAEEKEISEGELHPAALESLINYAYCGKVDISVENVQPLFLASQFLGLNVVRDACAEFLTKRLQVNNVVPFHILAHSRNNQNLIESSSYYMRENFEEISKSEDFLSLPYSCIEEIIANDVNVPCEEVVFESLMKWVKISPSERQNWLPTLLNSVRMINLPAHYLVDKVATEELIKTSIPCRDLIDEVKNYHWLLKEGSSLTRLNRQPRNLVETKHSLCSICHSSSYIDSVYYRDFDRDLWSLQSTMQSNFKNDYIINVVAVNEDIYLFFEKTILWFCKETGVWEHLKSMHRDIYGAAFLLHGDVVYYFGSLKPEFASKVRRFGIEGRTWLRKKNMMSDRYNAAAASLGAYIYLTGGYSGNSYCSTVEKYNPLTREWSDMAPMLIPRDRHSCTSLNGKIYACGGWGSNGRLCSAEVYDSFTNEWNFVGPMKNTRASFSLISHCRKMYALGGNRNISEAEVYDPESNQWKTCFPLPEGFKHAVLAIHNLPSVGN